MPSPCHCAALRLATRKLSAVYDAALEPFGINIAQFGLLRAIERRRSLSLSELGDVQGLDRSTVGRNVRVLERLGLVATRRGDEDQRETAVALTEQGTARLAGATPAWEGCQRQLEARLGAGAVGTLRDILETI